MVATYIVHYLDYYLTWTAGQKPLCDQIIWTYLCLLLHYEYIC